VWIGIAANLGIALPALIAPNAMLKMLGFPESEPAMWPSFAANLLILLSLFYVPPAMDPVRYRFSAYLTLVARLAGVIFFCGFHRDYILFGWFDLAFLVPQSLLLWWGISAERSLAVRHS
jgi:hypothetical protein